MIVCYIIDGRAFGYEHTLPFVADIAGILSFVISVITLLTAVGIRRAVLKNVEKISFRNEVDGRIVNLRSYYDSFRQDPNLYSEPLISKLQDDLEDLLISYESILTKESIKQIQSLKAHLEKNCLKNLNDPKAKTDCCHMLNTIATRINKEKNLL